MHLRNFAPLVRRVTRLAESIRLPARRRRPRTRSAPDPAAPVLVRGRGLLRRRPRSPLPSLLRWCVYLLLGAGITMAAFHYLLP